MVNHHHHSDSETRINTYARALGVVGVTAPRYCVFGTTVSSTCFDGIVASPGLILVVRLYMCKLLII